MIFVGRVTSARRCSFTKLRRHDAYILTDSPPITELLAIIFSNLMRKLARYSEAVIGLMLEAATT